LFINKRAKLEHKWSPVNRDRHGARQRRKLKESVIFYKKRRSWRGALMGQLLVMIWWFVEAIKQSLGAHSLAPVRGYFLGVIDGIQQEVKR
jgi:hypothetical protein